MVDVRDGASMKMWAALMRSLVHPIKTAFSHLALAPLGWGTGKKAAGVPRFSSAHFS